MGLLDKAKGSETPEHHELSTPSATEQLQIKQEGKSSSLLAKAADVPDSKLNSTTIVGGVVLLVSVLINAFLLGGYQPIPFIGWISLALVVTASVLISKGLAPLMTINRKERITVFLVCLFISGGGWLTGFRFDTESITISEVSIAEGAEGEPSHLQFSIFVTGSSGEVTVNLLSDSEIMWTAKVQVESSDGRSPSAVVEAPLTQIITGNPSHPSPTMAADYTIAASLGELSTTTPVDTTIMNRLATDVSAELIHVTHVETDPNYNQEGDGERYAGARLRLNIGMAIPGVTRQGAHDESQVSMVPVSGDYRVTGITIRCIEPTSTSHGATDCSDTLVWDHNDITVNGEGASWTPEHVQTTDFFDVGWLDLGGTEDYTLGDASFEYIERSEFYHGDGCYSITMSLQHLDWPGSPLPGFQESITGESRYLIEWGAEEDSESTPEKTRGC